MHSVRSSILSRGEIPVDSSTVTGMFLRQCRNMPEATALISSGQKWTYADILCASFRLAKAIRARTGGENKIIGLACARGPNSIVGLLGILEARAVFLPLDLGLPDARLDAILSDARPSLIVTDEPTRANMEERGLFARPVGSA